MDFLLENGYFQAMGKHTTIEATDAMSALIDRALAGDTVVITRGGTPVVEVKAVSQPKSGKMTPADLEWLRQNRVPANQTGLDAGAFVSQMRDEDWR